MRVPSPGRRRWDLARIVPGVLVTREQAASYAAEWTRRNQSAPDDRRPLWVALGDSMSQGVGAGTFDGGWVNQAARELAAAGHAYRILNLSATGATTSDVIARQLPRLVDADPALVTVLIGANDMLSPMRRRGLQDRFATIIETLPAGSVVARLPQPVRLAHRVNALLDAGARERGLVLVDLRPAARYWRGHRAPDYFHPNERGYARIADRFVRAILAGHGGPHGQDGPPHA